MGHGLYLSSTPSAIDFHHIRQQYGTERKIEDIYQYREMLQDRFCLYSNLEMNERMSSKAREIYGIDFDVSENSTSTNVVVDKLENVDKVYQRLLDDGYLVHKSIEIDYTPIKMFKYIVHAIYFYIKK